MRVVRRNFALVYGGSVERCPLCLTMTEALDLKFANGGDPSHGKEERATG